ncbi:MAG TPA: cobalamin-binding protein [Nitrososphaerales archaeon]|nr:cobalamin-binding protein [Nitrososphaerales archaeon]
MKESARPTLSTNTKEERHTFVPGPPRLMRCEAKVVSSIITTLPSATEIVCLLGLEDKLVGVTHECDYPPSVRKEKVVMKSIFDSTRMNSRDIDDQVIKHVRNGRSIYEIDEGSLQELKPDLVITQELCEACATPLQVIAKSIAKIRPKPKVLSLSPHSLEDILYNIIEVGNESGVADRAKKVASSLAARIDGVKSKCFENPDLARPSVFCLEWLDPLYCCGHWVPEIVGYAGGREILRRAGEPSFVTEWDKVVELDPEVIFVTVCGYHVERTLSEISTLTQKQNWNGLRAVKNGRVYVLDSPAYFSRSGPRLVDGLEIMAALLHPTLFPECLFPERAACSLEEHRYLSTPML